MLERKARRYWRRAFSIARVQCGYAKSAQGEPQMSIHKRIVSGILLSVFAIGVLAQEAEEIVVTAQRRAETVVPGTMLRRAGDFALLQVDVTNDTREAVGRRTEIFDTLRAALAAAKRDGAIELSTVSNGGMVLPLKVDTANVLLENGSRPDTSRTSITVKTKIPGGEVNGPAIVAKLRSFVATIKPVGRTQLDATDDVEISVVNPNQYRDAVIQLFAADVREVTGALGDNYRVVVRGVDKPVQWIRTGVLELGIFVPYTYDVLPATMTAYVGAVATE
jgi:hypothetical protein